MGDNNLIVKKNKKGFGIYAGRLFRKGEVICILKGIKQLPRNMSLLGDDFRNGMMNPLQIGQRMYLELDKPYIYLNHSCVPNAGIRLTATLFAIKNIKKGEEITFDYSTTIDESFECQCGSKNCRGAISDFFALPKKIQKYYFQKGALPDFIMKKYKKCHGK